MKTEDEIFALMAIAKEQQRSIDTAIVKMTTMAEEITEENQKLFNQNMGRQVKAHNDMMTNVNSILAKRVWTSHMIYTLIGCVCVCAAVLAGSWGYEQYLMKEAVNLAQSVKILKRDGGEADVGRCDGRACVRVNTKYGAYGGDGKTYYVIG